VDRYTFQHYDANFKMSLVTTKTFLKLTFQYWQKPKMLINLHCFKVQVTLCNIYYRFTSIRLKGPAWSWSCGSWIYYYLCNQRLSPLNLWVRIPIMARCTRYNILW